MSGYLAGVEAGAKPGPCAALIDAAKRDGREYTKNACRFFTVAHAAAASELLGSESLVWAALRDLEHSPLDDKHKALLRFVGKVTRDLPGVWRDDVATLQALGWDDDAIYFAISVCALFNFSNRWITATGVPEMSPEAHRLQGKHLARGYVRD